MSAQIQRVVVAPDSFKGSLSAQQVCEVVATAFQEAVPNLVVDQLPLADGGEGTVDAFLAAVGGRRITKQVTGPYGEPLRADYALLPDGTAVIEMAAAAGLPLVGEGERDIMRATTYGVGELISNAVQRGLDPIYVGLGGSATNDGGVGAALALGLEFTDQHGEIVREAAKLIDVSSVRQSTRFAKTRHSQIIFLSDVKNPLCGQTGASHIYGPQKGASADQVRQLDRGLAHLADVIKADRVKDWRNQPGVGAAGGFALPFLAYFGAQLTSGIDFVLDLANFDQQLLGTDLVISGEGRTDAQSAMGKAISAIARRCEAAGVPLLLLSGSIAPNAAALLKHGVKEMISITPPSQSLNQALAGAGGNLRLAARKYFENH